MKKGVFFQWVMTIAINIGKMIIIERKKNAPNMVTLDNENMLACAGEYSFRKRRALWEFERIYMAVREVLQLLTLFERELLQDIFFLGLSFREAGERGTGAESRN